MSGNNSDFIVAAVALVVSVVALLATMMQVLQQYYASARGYSQCNEKVMGEWAKTKQRRFQWGELRFEVLFDAPVIFVSPPVNKNGPVPDEKIFYLDGTKENVKESWTTSDMDLFKEYKMKSTKERIHTADNERASWFVLLYAAQRMEKQSREWQLGEYTNLGPPNAHSLPPKPPTLKDHHTLAVAVQRKRKSWDTVPASVIKPYATSTICHLVEMMAALGVYWKEFDRKRDRYWGEGNGFLVLGERLTELGLMFSFQIYGQCTFERNRVVPVDEIKELCFGYVPTIYREKLDQRRLKPPSDGEQNISSLQMGSRREIAETLAMIGCNNNTVRYFLDEGKRTSHLFPMSFEILGMLGRTFHIENSSFTYIPNPIPDHWDNKSVSLPLMLKAFDDKIGLGPLTLRRNRVIINRFREHIKHILEHQDEKNSLDRLLHLRALHLAIDDTDEILTGKKKRPPPRSSSSSSASEKASEEPASPVSNPEGYEYRREIVQDVLRHHIQEVVWLLNQHEEQISDSQSVQFEISPSSPTLQTHFVPTVPPPRFEAMNAAGPDDRQEILIDIYFDVVRKQVVARALTTTVRRNSAAVSIRSSLDIPRAGGHSPSRAGTPANDNGALDASGHHHEGAGTKATHEVTVVEQKSRVSLADELVSHDDIWCTLVFRMICWLMLHDFDKKDVQMPKSELLGSRMPVYIA